jgi:hypothetical protein
MISLALARDSAVLIARKRRIRARRLRIQTKFRRQGEDSVEDRLRAVISAIRACTDNDEDTRYMSPRELFLWATESINKLTKNGKQHTEFIANAVGLMHTLEEVLKSDTS